MIDQRAVVLTKKIADNVEIGPFAVIGEQVELGEGCSVGPHAVIQGRTKLGKGNKVFQFASIGEIPQDKKYAGEDTALIIGDHNVFRENCTVHTGTVQGGGVTKIGDDNLFMVGTHVAHDCIVGNHTVFANGATLAGHVQIHDYVILGGFTKIAQFLTVGEHAFLIGGSDVSKDILPYVIAGGPKGRLYGLNLVGLKRAGFTKALIEKLHQAYNLILHQGLTARQAIEALEELSEQCSEIAKMKRFLEESTKGILRE